MMKKNSIPEEWKNNIIRRNGSDDYYLWLLLLESGAKGVINPDKLFTHVYTGQNTGLDAFKLMSSAKEVVEQMESKISKRNVFAAKRRINYYEKYKPSLMYKIRYFDVGFRRWWYYKRFL